MARPFSLIPGRLEREIRNRVVPYGASPLAQLDSNTGPLAIKYVPARHAKRYRQPAQRLRISGTPGFTWGTGTYVAHIANPLSSAIFGRAGVVTRYDPTGWRVFDARDPQATDLYVQWAGRQPLYGPLLLTTHSQICNQLIRNDFRTRFRIDCVLFNPDQSNPTYTRSTDVWMAVSDFNAAGELMKDADSNQLVDARLAVIVAEEFESPDPQLQIVLDALIGPISPLPPNAGVVPQIMNAYTSGTQVYVTL